MRIESGRWRRYEGKMRYVSTGRKTCHKKKEWSAHNNTGTALFTLCSAEHDKTQTFLAFSYEYVVITRMY